MPNKVDLRKSKIISGGHGTIEEQPMFTIRSFNKPDQQAARRLILKGLGEYFGYINTSINPDIDDIWATYVQSGHLFVIADIAGEIAGTGGLMIHPDRTGQLVRMSVDTKFRRKGIGRAIVNHLLKIGGEHSLERFIVETHRGWDNARKLYQHCGFQIYQEDNESIYLQCFQPTIGHLN